MGKSKTQNDQNELRIYRDWVDDFSHDLKGYEKKRSDYVYEEI